MFNLPNSLELSSAHAGAAELVDLLTIEEIRQRAPQCDFVRDAEKASAQAICYVAQRSRVVNDSYICRAESR